MERFRYGPHLPRQRIPAVGCPSWENYRRCPAHREWMSIAGSSSGDASSTIMPVLFLLSRRATPRQRLCLSFSFLRAPRTFPSPSPSGRGPG
jgi:hypothetical protein